MMIRVSGQWKLFQTVHSSTLQQQEFPETPAGHPSSTEGPVLNPQLALHSQTRRWSHHRELIHRRLKERHADVQDSTHLATMCTFARGHRKQHPQHFERWRTLMDVISIDDVALLHDTRLRTLVSSPSSVLMSSHHLEVSILVPFRMLRVVYPIVDVMIIHVFEPCQPAS